LVAVGLDPWYATHTCRHTYATHLYQASGADLEIVQEQLGDASIKTTTIYAKVTEEDKARAADALVGPQTDFVLIFNMLTESSISLDTALRLAYE
jgi:integrase